MKILITAGGTTEPIDRVRGISNFATGMLGKMIAEECLKNGTFDQVYFLATKTSFKPEANQKLKIIEADDVEAVRKEMLQLIQKQKVDVLVHSMAISDYQVDRILTLTDLAKLITKNQKNWTNNFEDNLNQLNSNLNEIQSINRQEKISSQIKDPILFLRPTIKIASEIKKWNSQLYYVGFKLLDHVPEKELIQIAQQAMKTNQYQLVVANDLKNIHGEKHEAYLITPNGQHQKFKTKLAIAKAIVKTIIDNQ
jgi:phosphopantothenate---cysteine ligase (CTP)